MVGSLGRNTPLRCCRARSHGCNRPFIHIHKIVFIHVHVCVITLSLSLFLPEYLYVCVYLSLSLIRLWSRGPCFELQCSVRQGCPLAPHLHLFVTEDFCAYLQEPSNSLTGLPVPNEFDDLLLSKYANDMMIFQ